MGVWGTRNALLAPFWRAKTEIRSFSLTHIASVDPHFLSSIGPLCGLRHVGVVHTISWGFRRANIGPPLLVILVAALTAVVPSPGFRCVDDLFLPQCRICLGTGRPNGLLGCTRSTHWGLRPCIHLYYNSLRVTRYVRGETIDPRNFGSQSCYYPRESVL